MMQGVLLRRRGQAAADVVAGAVAVRRWWLPSLGDAIFLMVVFVVLRMGRGMLSADGDAARHLTVGNHILDSGGIPREDVFSHTMAGQPFVPYEWLAEVASALAFRGAGLAGSVMLHAVLLGLTFAILFAHLRSRRHAVLLALGVTILAASTSSVHWIARPHLFTLLGTAIFAAVLDGWFTGRIGPRWLWLLPIGMVAWANLHGGFLIGFIVLGIYAGADVLRWSAGPPGDAWAAGRRLRVLGPVTIASLAATLLTPAGPGLLSHVTGYLGNHLLVDRTAEYTSPNFHMPAYRVFLFTVVLGVAVMAWSRRRPQLHEGALFLLFLAFGLYSVRNIPLFAIITAPLLAAHLEHLPRVKGVLGRCGTVVGGWLSARNAAAERSDRAATTHVWGVAGVGVFLLLAVASARGGPNIFEIRFDEAQLPVGATAYLTANPPVGSGFAVMHWGGYLLHELWPVHRVFIDGQTDFYGEQLFAEYLAVAELRAGWEEILARHHVEWIVFQTDSPLVRTLEASPGWRAVYQDEVATVVIRTAPEGS